jgi:hypothetical protein
MKVEHLAIDGSVITFEAEADLSTKATAAGWAIVPALMRSHPFTISPAGHSAIVEQTVRSSAQAVGIGTVEEYRLKNGSLRLAEVRVPTATHGVRELTVGAWEGETGCLSTSLRGHQRNRLIEVFDTLDFGPRRGGLAIDSPVVAQPRAPEVIKEIPQLGIVSVRPAISSELERVPKARGFATDFGELFRVRKTGNALLFVTRSATVSVTPVGRGEERDLLAIARTLRVEWMPRGSATIV